MAAPQKNPPKKVTRQLTCKGCSTIIPLDCKLSERHTIACPGSMQPPTEEIEGRADGTCQECDQVISLARVSRNPEQEDDTYQLEVVDWHLVNVGSQCGKPADKPEKMTCSVCKKEYVLRGDGKCRYHFISNECTGSNLQPSPDYTTPGEGENKFGACSVCELPRKLKSSRDGLFLVEKHSAPKIQCEGSGLTTEEMKIAMEVKETNPDPADVDAVTETLGATSISDKKKARSPK